MNLTPEEKNYYSICLDKVSDWLEINEDVAVEYSSEPGNFYYYDDGLISIYNRQATLSKLYSLLHEAGHHIVRKNNSKWNISPDKTKSFKVDVVREEVLAWETAASVARYLNIWSGIDKEHWNKFLKEQLHDYICWAANPEKTQKT